MKGNTMMKRLNKAVDRMLGRTPKARFRRAIRKTMGVPGIMGAGAGFGVGAATGAISMYALDPARGRTRRAKVRDKFVSVGSDSGEFGQKATRVRNRMQGLIAEGRKLFTGNRGMEGQSRGRRFEYLQENWSPAPRLLAGLGGGALMTYAMMRRNKPAYGLGLLGLGLVTRSVTNRSMARMTGLGQRRGISIYKSLTINAPVDEVYRYWSNYEHFPEFMRNVRHVTDMGNGRSHWVVAGPGGIDVEWDAEITDQVENKIIAWKSVPSAAVHQTGRVRFTPSGENATRVHVHMRYSPPAGEVGHAIASLFGANPKTEMDEDLMRMKTTIENVAMHQ